MSTYVNVLVILLLVKYALNQWPELEDKNKQTTFLVVSAIVLALFTGLRDQYTGTDTNGYINAFFRYRKYDSISEIMQLEVKNDEYGYALFTWLIGRFTDNVNIYFTILAGIFAYSLAKFIHKNSQNCFFSMILYYTVGMFSFQMTGMRQALAMALLLFGVECIKEKKLIKFLLIVWLASTFHRSAFSFLAAYPIAHMKINFRNFSLYFLSTAFVIVFRSKISAILGKFFGYEYELGNSVSDDMGGITVIGMLLLTIIVCYIFYKQVVVQNKFNTVFFNITMASLIIYLLRYMIRIFERVSFYYQFAFIILLPNVISAIPEPKTRRIVYVSAITLACLLFFYRAQIKGVSYYGFLYR